MTQGKTSQIRLLITLVVMVASLGAAAAPRAAATTAARPALGQRLVTRHAAMPEPVPTILMPSLHAPVSTTLVPGVPKTLAYTDTHGLRTQLDFGAGAVTETTTLVLTPTLLVHGGGQAFAGHAFELAAFREGPLSSLSFGAPVSVTIQYSDTDILLVSDESALALRWSSPTGPQDAAQTCDPAAPYTRDVAGNSLGGAFCRAGRFGLFGPTNQLFLPIAGRDESTGNPNQAGLLDPSFDGDGKVTGEAGEEGTARALAVLPDGKILVMLTVGYQRDGFVLIRYKADGGRDTGFGDQGVVRTAFANAPYARSLAMAVQPDGKIILGGMVSHPISCMYCPWPPPSDLGLARYNADGTLDTSFGAGGQIVIKLTSHSTDVDLALQPDGKLVVLAMEGNNNAILIRIDASGSPDSTFGDQGQLPIAIFGDSYFFPPSALAVQPDGKLVVAGTVMPKAPDLLGGFGLVRFTSTGAPDTGFGDGGKVLMKIAGIPTGIVLQPDGKIVVVGNVYNNITLTQITLTHFALVRYQPDGALDLAFGYQGQVMGTFSDFPGGAYAIIRQPDGKLVVAGTDTAQIVSDFALARYRPNGSLDPTFGEGGKVTTEFSDDFDGGLGDIAYALALQPDGKLIAGGVVVRQDGMGLGLVRYLGDPQPAP